VVCGKQLRKGQKKCCSRSCSATYGNKKATGEKARAWKGGRSMNSDGYWRVYMPIHPYACSAGYVYEHRLVMELYLGRYLLPSEVVHHINGDKTDNRLKNLQLLSNQAIHCKIHNIKEYIEQAREGLSPKVANM
jgi:hypothetical protein